MRADDLYNANKQRKNHICAPLVIVPPASPFEDRTPSLKLHDNNIDS
jgi:hypothetical protein